MNTTELNRGSLPSELPPSHFDELETLLCETKESLNAIHALLVVDGDGVYRMLDGLHRNDLASLIRLVRERVERCQMEFQKAAQGN